MENLDFNCLPVGCVSTILSLTTPRDACRSSLVSLMFRSAAESDLVWEKFLPSDYKSILSKSISPVLFSTKKELFFRLQDPILIDDGNKMFTLEKSSGKISYMLSAKELSIAGSDDQGQWNWITLPESRFSEVAELRSTSRLDIQGNIKTNSLSPQTNYVAYLVIKFTDCVYGLDSLPSELSVEVGNKMSKSIAYLRRKDTKKQWLEHLYYSNRIQMLRSRVSEGEERTVKARGDGWMEVELGEFFNHEGANSEVKMSLTEVKGDQLKGGLIIEGIELRPKM